MDKIFNFFGAFNNINMYRITPRIWERNAWRFSLGYIAIELLVITTGLGLILSLFIGWNAFIVSGVVGIIRLVMQVQSTNGFMEVPYGYYALGKIQGEVQGKFKGKQYHLIEGKYRYLSKIIFFGDIFSMVLFPKEYPNRDVNFLNIKTKDGILLLGTKTLRKANVNPWKTTSLMLSTANEIKTVEDMNKIIDEKIEDISLQAINNACDNMTLQQVMKAGDGSDGTDRFVKQFNSELGKLTQLTPKEPHFLTGQKSRLEDEFYFDEVGLNVAVSIKTLVPMDKDVINALKVEVVAGAEKVRLILEGEGKAAAERELARQITEAYKDAYQKLVLSGVDPKVAQQKAALIANLYAHETVTEIGNSDGTPIQFDLAKIFALIKSFWTKNK
ncbi:hypothetical protein KC929_01195 [Patescibacteria group bacterium]|nr:hypothetical protein [Patescibacteria group bacterium]